MSRYLQVYGVELAIKKGIKHNPTQEYQFNFLESKKVIIGGFRTDVNKIFCKESIKDTGKLKLNEVFTIFDIKSKTQIGTGKIIKILVQG